MRSRIVTLLIASAALVGCDNAAGPERHSLAGAWTSEGFAVGEIEFGIAETARALEGAGRWVRPDTTLAFGVTGSNAEGSVALLFDIDSSPDLNFLGTFVEEDRIVGTVAGAGLNTVPLVLVRVEVED